MSFVEVEQEKSFDPLDSTVTLVNEKDDLDPFSSEDGVLKARLSCGHVVSPESLTDACRAQLDEGNYKFKCSAMVGGRLCNSPLSYREVRRLADLTVEEMQYFEENMARLAAAEYSDIQRCPKCKTNIERKDMTNLCVKCSICSADQSEPYLVCWQCLKPWKGHAHCSDRCDNSFFSFSDTETFTNMGRHDAPNISPTAPFSRTEDENIFTEKKEQDETHSYAFNRPVRPEESRPGRDECITHSRDEQHEAKRGNTSRKNKFDQDKSHEHNVSKHSTPQNYSKDVIIERPNDTEQAVNTKYKESHVTSYRDSRDENNKPSYGTSARVKGVDYPQYDGRQREDMDRRQQSRRAGHFSEEYSQPGTKWDQQYVLHPHPRLVEYRQQYVQREKDRNSPHRQVQQSQSYAPDQSRMNRHHHRHSYRTKSENPTRRRDPERESINRSIPVGRHSFHGSRKPYYSQDVQLENFRKAMEGNKMRNEEQKKNVRREAQNARLSQETVHNPQPRRPQQYLERLNNKEQSRPQDNYRDHQSQRPNSGHGGSHSLGRGNAECHPIEKKSKDYEGKNAKTNDSFRNKVRPNITGPEEEIRADSLVKEMKDLTFNDSSKTTEEIQTGIKVETEVELETNDKCKIRERTNRWAWIQYFIPFKKRRTN